MTDHPKPIARYAAAGPMLPVKQDKAHVMKTFILDADHEAALAAKEEEIAGHIAMLEASQRTMYEVQIAKDARIAELEREAIKSADRLHEARSDSHKLSALRTAIEAKAREWDKEADEMGTMTTYAQTCVRECASELLALLEKKP